MGWTSADNKERRRSCSSTILKFIYRYESMIHKISPKEKLVFFSFFARFVKDFFLQKK